MRGFCHCLRMDYVIKNFKSCSTAVEWFNSADAWPLTEDSHCSLLISISFSLQDTFCAHFRCEVWDGRRKRKTSWRCKNTRKGKKKLLSGKIARKEGKSLKLKARMRKFSARGWAKRSLGKFVKKSSFIKNYANLWVHKRRNKLSLPSQLFITFNNTSRRCPAFVEQEKKF